MKSLRWYEVWFCLILSWISIPVWAAPSSIHNSHIIRISAGEWPPFIGQHLENNGFVAEIIRKVFKDAGYEVEFHFFPWARAYAEAKAGRYDATAIWMFNQERTVDFYYSEAVSDERFVFFHHKETDFHWESLYDLKGLHLGGGIAYSYGAELDRLLETQQIKMSRVNDPKQNFERLAKKRIDLMPEEIHIGYYTLDKYLPQWREMITHHPKPFLINNNYLLFPKMGERSEQLLTLFNHGLKESDVSMIE